MLSDPDKVIVCDTMSYIRLSKFLQELEISISKNQIISWKFSWKLASPKRTSFILWHSKEELRENWEEKINKLFARSCLRILQRKRKDSAISRLLGEHILQIDNDHYTGK